MQLPVTLEERHGYVRCSESFGPYLFVQGHVALLVHLVLCVIQAGTFAGAQLNVDVDLTEEQNVYIYSCDFWNVKK